MAPSIYEKNKICRARFCELLASSSSPSSAFETIKGQLRDEFDKYSIWTDSHGADHPPTSSRSLDHRLRFASPYKEEIIKILDIIASQLQPDVGEWLNIPKEVIQQPETGITDIVSDSDSESTWDVSSESDSGDEFASFSTRPSKVTAAVGGRAQQVLEATQLAIKFLYMLPLRKPAPIDRLKDKCVEERSLLPHAFYDQLYIRDKFPALDSAVQKRISRLITRRRELLDYRREHSNRLALKASETEETQKSQDAIQGHPGPTDAGLDNHVKIPRPGPTTIFTKATTLQIDPEMLPIFQQEPCQRHSTQATVSADYDTRTSVAGTRTTREIQIQVPPRPKTSDGSEATHFKCNYCCLPVQIETDWAWREHVLTDLQPFVCTFANCQLEDYLFDNVDTWYRHEMEFHRVELFCNISGHKPYTSRFPFVEHLRIDHGLVPELSAEELQMFQRPVKSLSGICNLCQGHTSNLKRHISRHLRQVALFALPRLDYYSEDDEDVQQDVSSRPIRDRGEHPATQSSGNSEPIYGLKRYCGTSFSVWSHYTDATEPDSSLNHVQAEDAVLNLDLQSAEASSSIPPSTEPISWDQVSTYGVTRARDAELLRPPYLESLNSSHAKVVMGAMDLPLQVIAQLRQLGFKIPPDTRKWSQLQNWQSTTESISEEVASALDGIQKRQFAQLLQQRIEGSLGPTGEMTQPTTQQETNLPAQPASDNRLLACPFYKHNPKAYLGVRACEGPGWPSTHRVKEHVYRRHTPQIHCPRCGDVMRDQNEFDVHRRHGEPCKKKRFDLPKGLGPEQEAKSRSRKRIASTEEEKWRIVYNSLFPDVPEENVPSPYYETGVPDKGQEAVKLGNTFPTSAPRPVMVTEPLTFEDFFSSLDLGTPTIPEPMPPEDFLPPLYLDEHTVGFEPMPEDVKRLLLTSATSSLEEDGDTRSRAL